MKFNHFDRKPPEWSERSGRFIAKVDKRPIPDSEKMSHLKTLLTGKEQSAVFEMGQSGLFYGVSWSILEKKFGQPHVIIDTQLEGIQKGVR